MDTPRWWIDELESAGRENLDSHHAVRYDHKEDAGALEELARLERWGLDDRSTVLDMGAGTGQFTLAAASRCAAVVAVDVSPAMLSVLRAKVVVARLTNVEVVQAGFLTYDHAGPLVDVVYSRFALHHLPDAWKVVALSRLRRVLQPGGVLRLSDVVYGFDPAEAEERLEAWCASIDAVTSDDRWTRNDIEEHVRDEHSTFTWLLEPMIERSGFRIEEAVRSPDGIFAAYVARAV